MKTTKTIEVQECDFCVDGKSDIRQCVKCGKDACPKCCYVYRVARERPQPMSSMMSGTMNLSFGNRHTHMSAVFCDDCGRSEAETALLRAGFEETPTGFARNVSAA